MKHKILFLDRDGTLVREPADEQVDRVEKIDLLPGVIPALRDLAAGGYQFVIVSNQDGRGTPAFPEARFEATRDFLNRLFASQGIQFLAEFYCPHLPADQCGCRKPKVGLLRAFLQEYELDRNRSAVVGDRDSDMELAEALGLDGLRIQADGDYEHSWAYIARRLLSVPRRATVRRETAETRIRVTVDLDRAEPQSARTGIGFFDHMLEQLARHGGFALELRCEGDLDVDDHHTVEDVALALGEALRRALGDKRGIGRYGFVVPMDETLAEAAVDLSGRPYAVFRGQLERDSIGGLSAEMVSHFFRSLAESLGAAIHVSVRGSNSHHKVEGAFKAVGRALRPALARSGTDLPSTKGAL